MKAEGRAAELHEKIMDSISRRQPVPRGAPPAPSIPDNVVALLEAALIALGEIATTFNDIVGRLEELAAILTTLMEAPSAAELDEDEEEDEEEEEEEEPVKRPARVRRKRSP